MRPPAATPVTTPSPVADSLFAHDGEMASLMRSTDWASTPLGPIAGWSRALRMMVGLLIRNRFPLLLWWGPEFVQLYNDAYKPIPGIKHPRALGQPAAECWAEIWDVIGPMIDAPFRGEPATSSDDLSLMVRRKGFLEESHFKVAYSPVPDEAAPSGIGGVLATVAETTEEVYARRQLATLRDLAAQAAEAKTAAHACELAAATLKSNARDIPCAFFYLVDKEVKQARLVGAADLDDSGADAWPPPRAIPLDDAATDWPVAACVRERRAVVVDAGAHRLPSGAWQQPPEKLVFLPLAAPEQETAHGVLVAAASPHRALDEAYRSFFDLAAQHVVSAIRNATAYEDARRTAEALAAIDRAKTAFFSNVSHEFRTPLTLMLAPIEDMRAALPNGGEERERVDLLYRNALRLLKLVNSLLEFSRIEAGRVEAVFEPVDLAALTADLASTFRSAIERAGLTFVVDCTSTEPTLVDRSMWEKIVLNLLSNALKFTFDGGIVVRLRAVGAAAELEVCDTGEGIPAAELPRLFERFRRVVSTRSRSQEGSGIGLALVHELVRMQGGTIDVASTQGEGTTFRIRIPRGTAHVPTERIRAAGSPPATATTTAAFVEEAQRWVHPPSSDRREGQVPKDGRVLVADDNADMRDYLRRLLADHWEVEAVNNGADALAAIRRQRPDLVVSDVMMPGLDGFGLLHAIRSDADLRDLQVILLSARAGEEATAEGLKSGADDYLVKPFSARDLLIRVAARLTASKARAAERRRLLTLLEQIPANVNLLRGPDLVFEFAHPMAVKALGGRELLGKKLLDAMPEHHDQPYFARMRRVYETGEPFSQREAEARLMVRGRETVTYWDSLYQAVRDEAGRIEGVMTFDIDVTENVAARKDAERARALLATAQRAARIGVFHWDGRSGKVYWSPELYALLGRHAGEIEPTVESWIACIHPDDREAASRRFEEAIAQGTQVYQLEERVLHPDGQTRWLRVTQHLTFDEAGQVTRCIGAAVDVQELKELAERERTARLAAEDATLAKDDFLAMLGHELRNPLAPIATAVHLLKLRGKEGIAREVSVIERQSQHIARLVDDLLDISRIVRGKVTLDREPFAVADLIAAAIETASPVIETSRHEVLVEVPKHGLVVSVDRWRMTQVIANLLTNAAKYTPAGGRILIGAAREGTDIVISVEDTGVGIAAELLPRVFDLFVQARQTLDRAQGGLGLGLALVKNLVAMHGGTVAARSEGPGRGSAFAVRLPSIDATASDERPSDAITITSASRRRLLVVDDNEDNATMMGEALEHLGYRIAVAHDGPQALRIAAEFAPSVALLDLGLPIMDGYEVAGRLRAQSRDVKLVAITGYGQDSDRERTLQAGFCAHLTKPVDLAKLSAILATFSGNDVATETTAS